MSGQLSGQRTTILFFGDSATRGYGVGREFRFPALVAAELAARSEIPLTFDVGAAESDFRAFRSRLESELVRFRPLILVCQCPVGPACFFPRFPASVRTLLALEKKVFAWMTDRYVESEIRRGERTRHDALYEGKYLDRVNRWKPSNRTALAGARRSLSDGGEDHLPGLRGADGAPARSGACGWRARGSFSRPAPGR